MKNKTNKFIALAISGLIAGGALAPAAFAGDHAAPADGDHAKADCHGKDDCKGKADKGTCKGKDSCKGEKADHEDSCSGKDGCKGK